MKIKFRRAIHRPSDRIAAAEAGEDPVKRLRLGACEIRLGQGLGCELAERRGGTKHHRRRLVAKHLH